MSQQDNFSSGFVWGAVLGGIAGGLIGSTLANRLGEPDDDVDSEHDSNRRTNPQPEIPAAKSRRRPLRLESAPQKNMELARQSLENKIASLNDAIDDVRQQLHQVNAEDVRSPRSGGDDVAMGRGARSTAKPNGDSPTGETS
ncbi:MAG: hypothetical protein H7237_01450 [Alkalinema sp. FL-bin-369]|nr:hypothetical protein [Leptolyngbyaceae cyanobacterium LF-bin-369]